MDINHLSLVFMKYELLVNQIQVTCEVSCEFNQTRFS